MITLTVMLTLALATSAAASSVHLKGGKHAKPAFFDGGLTLNASGALAGLGNGDILISLTAMADVTSTCTNQGGNQAPGQNPAPIIVSGVQEIPESEIKNVNAPIDVWTELPETPIPDAPDCSPPMSVVWTNVVVSDTEHGVTESFPGPY